MIYLKSMEITVMEDAYLYSEEDIDKDYDMGLRSAIYVLEKTVGLSIESQIELIEKLKKLTSYNEDSD